MIEREKLVVFPREKEGTPHIYSGCGRLTVLGNMGLLSCTGELEVYKTGKTNSDSFRYFSRFTIKENILGHPTPRIALSVNGFVGNV